ncbi:LysE family translocator [Actinoalloteichus hymeniacidonis]|uniref:LysE family translocator n=1 Tax=Actinoalloteichus hymeniacidonis TaxID=340345 RepID=UPI000853E963|nr:LysE family translocator [Actinoalloteichus hymeniacidonis]MBB5909185.1 threonine/homoserine/homoserine lactone efflux protein [Actinoalloteichus hymeniacidonis]
MPEGIPLFIAITALTIVVPGPDFVLVTRNTLLLGRRAGYLTAAGISIGLTVYTLLAVLGLTALIAAQDGMLTALKLAGGGYLVFLGWRGLRSWWRSRRAAGTDVAAVLAQGPAPLDTAPLDTATDEPTRAGLRGGGPLAQGVLNNLLNPKALVFYVTLLPQFITPGDRIVEQTLLLSTTATLLAVLWWFLFVTAVDRVTPILRRRRVRDGLDLGTAVLLGGFGIAVAAGAL